MPRPTTLGATARPRAAQVPHQAGADDSIGVHTPLSPRSSATSHATSPLRPTPTGQKKSPTHPPKEAKIQHEPTISSLSITQLRLLEALDRLSIELASASAPTSVAVGEPKYTCAAPKLVREPDCFYGNRSDLEGFLAAVNLYFDAYPSSFSTDKRKINFILSNLRGPVFASYQPFIRQRPQRQFLTDYSSFLADLRRYWSAGDEKMAASVSYHYLKQTGSAVSFFNDYRRLIAILGWEEDHESMILTAITKLSDDLQDEIVRARFKATTLNELAEWVTALDNRCRTQELFNIKLALIGEPVQEGRRKARGRQS